LFGLLDGRAWIIRSLLEKDELFKQSDEEMDVICNLTDGVNIFPVNRSILCTTICFSNFFLFLVIYLYLVTFFLGYSGSDMKNLVKDASMGPLRDAIGQGIDIMELKKEDMRPVTFQVCKRVHSETTNFKNIYQIDY